MASGSCHRFVIAGLASATLVVAPAPASTKTRDCKGAARQGSVFADCAAIVATPAEAAASAEEAARAKDLAAHAQHLAERTDYQLLYKYPDKVAWSRLMVAELDIVNGHLDQAIGAAERAACHSQDARREGGVLQGQATACESAA